MENTFIVYIRVTIQGEYFIILSAYVYIYICLDVYLYLINSSNFCFDRIRENVRKRQWHHQ